jgi:hypothetical protein
VIDASVTISPCMDRAHRRKTRGDERCGSGDVTGTDEQATIMAIMAVLGSGVLSLVLAWMLWKQWPLSGNWAVGILVGINLLSTGISLIAVALTFKSAIHAATERVAEFQDRLS